MPSMKFLVINDLPAAIHNHLPHVPIFMAVSLNAKTHSFTLCSSVLELGSANHLSPLSAGSVFNSAYRDTQGNLQGRRQEKQHSSFCLSLSLGASPQQWSWILEVTADSNLLLPFSPSITSPITPSPTDLSPELLRCLGLGGTPSLEAWVPILWDPPLSL